MCVCVCVCVCVCERETILNQIVDLNSELRSCVKCEVDVLGFPVPNGPYGFCQRETILNQIINLDSELRSCVKAEVDVLSFPSLVVPMVSVNVKQY